MKRETQFPVAESASLLDFLLSHVEGQSRNSVKHLLSRGQVLVDNVPQTQFDLSLLPGQTVTILPQVKGALLPFPILYEDAGLLAINKPAGLLSVATESQKSRTAYRYVSDYLRARDPQGHLFVVHRLDRDTSGVLLFAKSIERKLALQETWNSAVKKRGYWAIVEGEGLPRQGVCRSQLTENKVHKVYSAKDGGGKEAVTRYSLLGQKRGYSLLDVHLDTGRKNQIRAHLSELGHPVAGDDKYGAQSDPLARLGLHAYELALTDPLTGKVLSFTAPPPVEFLRMFPKELSQRRK